MMHVPTAAMSKNNFTVQGPAQKADLTCQCGYTGFLPELGELHRWELTTPLFPKCYLITINIFKIKFFIGSLGTSS